MMKFAFLLIEPGQSPENYSGTYENKESFNLVAGFDALEDVKEYAGKLAEEGYNLINLCGEFDDEYTARIQEITGPDVKVYHADYTPEELVKIEAVSTINKYGVIIVMSGVEDPEEVVLSNNGSYAKAIFVKDQEQANEAAKQLTAEGMDDIELCSWFDAEKTQKVIEAIGGSVPVGSCGI